VAWRADHAAGALGRAHTPAVRQAAGVAAPSDPRGAARHVDSVLHLAMGAGLAGEPAACAGRDLRRARRPWRLASLESRSPHRARHDLAHGDLHPAPHLLPELQVRLLADARALAAAARGARA